MENVVADVAAPAEPAGAPIPTEQASHTAPLGSQTPAQPKPEEPKAPEPSKSVKDAVAKAHEQLKAKEAEAKAAPKEPAKVETPKAEAKPEVKPEAKAEAPRSPTGQFAAREPQQPVQQEAPKPTQFRDPPSRFDDAAKSEWANAPESVKGAVHRAVKELEEGLTKYKGSHERYEQLRQFDETAKSNGRDLPDSLKKVVEFETMMKSNPMAAIDYALRHAGPRKSDGSPLSLNDIVQHVSGQTVDHRLQAAQTEIHQLRTQIQEMETRAKIPDMVAEFASTHERFDELQPAMIPLLKQGFTLENAYEFALAMAPAKQAQTEPLTPANSQALAQTQSQPKPVNPAGQKSISGAPATGSDPDQATRRSKPISETSSVRDSLKKALARAS
jgi:hypothetical protein